VFAVAVKPAIKAMGAAVRASDRQQTVPEAFTFPPAFDPHVAWRLSAQFGREGRIHITRYRIKYRYGEITTAEAGR
jgi:hypothetical protein